MAFKSHWLLALAVVLGHSLPLASAHTDSCLINAVAGDEDRAQFNGESDFMVHDVRPYNHNYEYLPMAVMYPNSSQEISDIVKCAVDEGVKVQARSGGHDFINKGIGGADGAIVVDMKYFNNFSMEEGTGIATLGSGLTIQKIVHLLNDHGARMLPAGSYPTVGLGGHATVGGIGTLCRLHGLTLDFMESAEVVLANGTIVTASDTENTDIFWAIRGAAQSFGIVTQFRFQTLPQPAQIQTIKYELRSNNSTALADAYKAYHQIIRNQPVSKAFSTAAAVRNGVFYFTGHFFGTRPELDHEVDKLQIRQRLPPATNLSIHINSWVEINEEEFAHKSHTLDLDTPNVHFYVKDQAVPTPSLPSNASLDALFAHLSTDHSNWMLLLSPLAGGAANDVPADATAYPHRDIAYFVSIYAIGTTEATDATYTFVDEAARLASGDESLTKFGAYAGAPDGRATDPQERYWRGNLRRLQQIKAVVDPMDVFSTPQGVKPKAG